MARRRKVSSDVSAELVNYVLTAATMNQEQLAEALEVSPGFISRVRTGERSLTVDHLGAIEALIKVPLGALLLAAAPPPKARPGLERLHDLAIEAMKQADIASQAISKARRARAHATA